MITAITLLIVLLVGVVVGAFSAHAAAKSNRASADTIRAELANQFKVLSAQVLDDQSKKLASQHHTQLGTLLTPLGEKIADFKQKVEQVHATDLQQHSSLKTQIEMLATQSVAVGQKADHLASALKGDNKAIGNWGELILENLLDATGLKKDTDYKTQVSTTTTEGRFQPDVIVNLPNNKCIIIDAKASLKPLADAPTDAVPAALVASIETHIKNLSAKNYQTLPDLKDRTLDFVLMFIPSEPAFALALNTKPSLLETAIKSNILLVGPSSLLATLRLIQLLWRQENQNKSLSEVYEDVQKIYEKYVNFAENFKEIDDRLTQAKTAYDKAFGQLSTGPGNLVKQLEKFRKNNTIPPPKKLPPPAFQNPET